MSIAAVGDTVKIHYTGYLRDGRVFDSTVNDSPIIFTIGQGLEVPGIEKGSMGMKEGDIKTVLVQPEDAYGAHKRKLVSIVDREKLSGNINLRVGMKLRARSSTGILKDVTVCDISDSSITVDANHPLAGHELTFEIILIEIMRR